MIYPYLADYIKKNKVPQHPEELGWLLDQVKKLNPKIILEIGVQNGGTSICWLDILPDDGLLIGVDIIQKRPHMEGLDENYKFKFILKDSNSTNCYNKVINILVNKYIDFLFIDGSHDYYQIKKDYELYKHLVRSGGIIAFHDIYMQPKNISIDQLNLSDGWNGSVTRFWKELLLENKVKTDEFQADKDFNIGIGVIFNE